MSCMSLVHDSDVVPKLLHEFNVQRQSIHNLIIPGAGTKRRHGEAFDSGYGPVSADLIFNMGRGQSSTLASMTTARAAAIETHTQGGKVHPATIRIAALNQKNSNRDLRRAIHRARKRKGFNLEPYEASIPIKRQRGIGIENAKHYFLLPHELLHHAFNFPSVWSESIVGEHDDGPFVRHRPCNLQSCLIVSGIMVLWP